MAPPRFGTDGVRGVANADLTAEVALAVGRAVARVIPAPVFIVGRDTRRSGSLLQAALAAGMASEGADVADAGVCPTPGISVLCAQRSVPGAVVSASHNPFEDNGIKLFTATGVKLSRDQEKAVEEEMRALAERPDGPPRRPTGRAVGVVAPDPHGLDDYEAHLLGALGGRSLKGLSVVVDCANGAASVVAPRVLGALGATVFAIGTDPDGANINDSCGSTAPSRLAEEVVAHRADLGLAFDGDADRLVAVDATGSVVDGDALLALFALDMARRGTLAGGTVVVTVMTNLGFRLAMSGHGIGVVETPVGDRHVVEALDAHGYLLGGEQSGHVVFRALAPTGDGILTGLMVCEMLARQGTPLRDLTEGILERVPQVLANVPVDSPDRLADAPEVWAAVAEVEADLGSTGRVLLRASGTEPVVRVMVEAISADQARQAAEHLCAVVRSSLAPSGSLVPARSMGSEEPAVPGPAVEAPAGSPVAGGDGMADR